MKWLETDSLSNQNISSPIAIGVYTADIDRMIVCDISLDQIVGSGTYSTYVTRQINGAGSSFILGPKTEFAALVGETAIGYQSSMISVKTGDVLTAYVDGLPNDTAIVDTIVRWFDMGVWDELLANHMVAGTTGAALSSASAADPLTNQVPGVYASGSAGSALGRIGTGRIETTSIVAQSGAVETVQGDNYLAANGRRIEWTDVNNTWPDLTAATIKINVGGVVEFSGVVITATGNAKKVGVELTSTQSASIPANTLPGHDFQVRATIVGGVVATLVASNKPGNENAKWTSVEKLEVGS